MVLIHVELTPPASCYTQPFDFQIALFKRFLSMMLGCFSRAVKYLHWQPIQKLYLGVPEWITDFV